MNQKKQVEEAFEYTYSAAQQEEIERIRRKYAPVENAQDKMELLRQLDKQTTQKGTALSLAVGIAGTLVLGTGMSCVMVWPDTMFIAGIVIGLIGITGVVAAYPLHAEITRREREKASAQILRLIEELKIQ